ncbi:hypothetical protein AIIKEEIJ_02757 [Rhodococcus sp. YH1]|nr:hypothetical protein [Rhodococcus sp. YH1]
MVTISGNRLAATTCGISRLASIDTSVQLPTKIPPICSDRTASRASAVPVTPTLSSWASRCRTVSDASSSSPQDGAGDAVAIGAGDGDCATVDVACDVAATVGSGVRGASCPPHPATARTAATATVRV